MSADEHTRAVERDTALLERLGKLLEIVDRLIDRVAGLERELADERVARERLELRVNAEWLRDRGYTIRTALELGDGDHDDDAAGSSNVVPLTREPSPGDEPPAAGDEPAPRICSHCHERPTMDPRHDLCGVCDDVLAGGHRDV